MSILKRRNQGSTEELREGPGGGGAPRPWIARKDGPAESCKTVQRKSCRKIQGKSRRKGQRKNCRKIPQRNCMNVQLPGHQGSTEELQEGPGGGGAARPRRACQEGPAEICRMVRWKNRRKGPRKSCRKVQQEDPAEELHERPATRAPKIYG